MEREEFPLEFEEVSAEEKATLKVHRKEEDYREVRVVPGGFFLPYDYISLANHFYNFEFRSDDIVVATFPKSGTVWMGEIIWAMTHFHEIHKMDTTHIDSRSFFLDLDFLHPLKSEEKSPRLETFKVLCPEGTVENGATLQVAKATRTPRIIKTHLQFSLLNPSLLNTSKVVYVARNPKDTCVSFYYFLSRRPHMVVEGNFSDFAESFMESKINYTPYWDHLKQAWNLKNHPNFHFVFYEDMKANIMKELKKLRTFLGSDLSDDQLKTVSEVTNFEHMKSRDAERPVASMNGSFFRKGTVGDWKNMASPELNARMDKWIEKNTKDLDIDFKYE